MRASHTVVWAGGEHLFRLGIGELRAIEQATDAGISVVLMRLLGQQWKIDDVLSPIRLGLIGGGMEAADAKRTLDRALDSASPYALAITAAAVLSRFLTLNEEDEKPGEQEAGDGQPGLRSETDGPVGPISTSKVLPSDSRPASWTT